MIPFCSSRFPLLVVALLWGGGVLACSLPSPAQAEQRFPPPEFTDHQLPETELPSPTQKITVSEWWTFVLVAVALIASTLLSIRFRFRPGLFLLAAISMILFGFWMKGCPCAVGSTQNVALALFDGSYLVPMAILLLFIVPLAVTLFFGRTFCASVCPLGAIQEMVAVKPIQVPRWVDHSLGMLRYVYLGLAILLVATGTTFLICKYDPFIGFYRFSGNVPVIIFGVVLLGVGVFVGRPYCRYLCPYGALLGLCGKFAHKHVTVTPGECVKCRLCEEICPYGAIEKPTIDPTPEERRTGPRRLGIVLLLSPGIVIGFLLLGWLLAPALAQFHPDVRLAEKLYLHEQGLLEQGGLDDQIKAYQQTGLSTEKQYETAKIVQNRFVIGTIFFGGWVGLVFALKAIQVTLRRRRTEYRVDPARCLSCGRCFWYCPNQKAERALLKIEQPKHEPRENMQESPSSP